MTIPVCVSIDIGGVLSRAPDVFIPVVLALAAHPAIELFVLTDMERDTAMAMLDANGLSGFIDANHILCAEWATHGEQCKVVLRQRHGIRLHIDDLLAYAQHTNSGGEQCFGLALMPSNTFYNSLDWKK